MCGKPSMKLLLLKNTHIEIYIETVFIETYFFLFESTSISIFRACYMTHVLFVKICFRFDGCHCEDKHTKYFNFLLLSEHVNVN